MSQSFADPVRFDDGDPLPGLESLTPREKIEYFINGMKDNSVDLVAFRNDPELSDFVAEHEERLWSIKGDLELVLSSIQARPKLRIV